MKFRTDYVTNSSSSSFIIKNKTGKTLTMEDLFLENEWLYENEDDEWFKETYSFEDALKSAEEMKVTFAPHEEKEINCSDHYDESVAEALIHGTDGMFGSGSNKNESLSFSWRFYQSHH